ncbi:MAG TPA: hypothetical protein VJW20_01790 [Candidatus Angelobacter sp.]|nr:hypothetical protein [Candidatus Angelobacter sp.]
MSDLKKQFLSTIRDSQVFAAFTAVLAKIHSPFDVIMLIHRYSLFASNFAGGAATLMGAFHVSQDLFRDTHEEIQVCADKGAEIASCIFAAVDDEYIDRYTSKRVTHRNLSQQLVKEAAAFFNIQPGKFDRQFPLSIEMRQILQDVLAGFRFNQQNAEADLFFSLAFHVANEIFADHEFRLMNSFFRTRYPEMVRHLIRANAYGWIASHTVVEENHVSYGLAGIEMAIRYYAGARPRAELIENIVEGLAFAIALELRVYANLIHETAMQPKVNSTTAAVASKSS